nr:MAG TPA: hypothetical protein [Caudoviricetes sp.]
MKHKYTHAIVILNEYDSFLSGSIIIIAIDNRGISQTTLYSHDENAKFFVNGEYNQTGIKEYIKKRYNTDIVYFYNVVNGWVEE